MAGLNIIDRMAGHATLILGVVIALSGGVMVSMGMTLQKKAHMVKPKKKSSVFVTPLWWIGSASLGIGELLNFVAFAFAPASLLTPLGGWSVAIAGLLAIKILGERPSRTKMIGLALCICGTMMVFAVFPMQHIGDGVVMTAVELHTRFFKRGVFRYLMGQLVLIGLGILLDQISDFGKKSSMLYLATCSCSEGLSVIAAKTGSIFLRDSVREWSTAHLSYFAVVVIVLAVTLPLQVVFINKAMAEFGNTEVVPRHYVLFTLFTILGAQVVFKEFDSDKANPIGLVFAIMTTTAGVHLVASEDEQAKTAGDEFESELPA